MNAKEDKGSRKMSTHILGEDAYDRNGTLLLKKGTIVTDDIIEKLKRHGSNVFNEVRDHSDTHNEVSAEAVQTFAERKKIYDSRVLELPYKILNNIIFESKGKPWYIYVSALANYVDWLYTHSIDVAMISVMIGEELQLTDDELWKIGMGAFLHDIGKLLIPKNVIQKPAPLTDMEMVFIRQHCELGLSLIESIYLPKECANIILQHHERLDGSGYPNGLKGDEISLDAKIVMVADSVEAITSGRPYRQGYEINKVGEILMSEREKYPLEIVFALKRILSNIDR